MSHPPNKLRPSRNKAEGFYAGYYPWHPIFGKGGHRRWDAWAMSEFYPRVRGIQWAMNMITIGGCDE